MVPEPEGDEEACHAIEHKAPRVLHVAGDNLEIARQHDEQALSDDGGDAVEGGADAHEIGLFVLVEAQHIEAIGSDVVGGT